jgi:DNA-binding transcriptional LysR family regulator
MDKLRSMEVFVTVADCGSFTQAASQLNPVGGDGGEIH